MSETPAQSRLLGTLSMPRSPRKSGLDQHQPNLMRTHIQRCLKMRIRSYLKPGDVLLAAVEESISSKDRIRGICYGIADVCIHTMRGDRDRAISALREAVDEGWRAGDTG